MHVKIGIFEPFSATARSLLDENSYLEDLSWAHYIDGELERFAPINGRFNYPADKLRPRQYNMQMQQAEQRLDLPWSKIDEKIAIIYGGQSIGDLIPAMDFSDRMLERTRDWEPSQDEKPNTVDASCQADTFTDFSWNTEECSQSFRTSLNPKSKSKTKGMGSAGHNDELSDQLQPQIMEEVALGRPSVFCLKDRHLRVFYNLFHQPSNEDAVGKIKWKDFLAAMSSVGFSNEKLGSSAWQFTPPIEWETRGISFHEPHGFETKISFGMGRQIGRRLQKVYGWGRSTFVAG